MYAYIAVSSYLVLNLHVSFIMVIMWVSVASFYKWANGFMHRREQSWEMAELDGEPTWDKL